ncbi:MAG: thioredoxin family protein [Actinomycetota bacterium]|nr:thioredoxin family protein [Actinomycetota bacterium]
MDRALLVLAIVVIVAVVAAALRRRGGADRVPPARVDPAEFGLEGTGRLGVIGFFSPYCVSCQRWERELHEAGVPWARVDVGERVQLARRYGVSSTPLVLAVELPEGRVVEAYEGDPQRREVERLAERVAG